MSTVVHNQQVKQIFIRAIRLSYYLGPTTKTGLAVIYACFSFNGKQYRVSTGLKVYVSQWSSRCHYALIGSGMSPLDVHNNTIVNNRLREIDIAFLEKIEYFCTHYENICLMPEELLKVINPVHKMAKVNKKDKTPNKFVTQMMIDYRVNHTQNERSLSTIRTNILDFRKFLDENNIPDVIESMTADIASRYAEWLKKHEISINTANQRIRALATNLKNLTTIVDLNFKYPLPAKLPLLKESLTGDELENNDVSLTEEQIEVLYNLDGLSEKESVARDIFCLQCWTGVRVGDVVKVLDSANLKVIDGVSMVIFRPEKTKRRKNIRAIIPLTTIFPKAYEIVKKYQDNPPKYLLTGKNNYNELIRAVCRIAKFDEVHEKTSDLGGGKTTKELKLWELMSSHKGRHSFVTNCKRRGIADNDIIRMTGHASTDQIKKTYDNTNAEDNARLLLGALSGEQTSRTYSVPQSRGTEARANFNPVKVLQRALTMLGGEIKQSQQINLVHLAEQLINKKAEIIKKYGLEFYNKVKETIMQGQSSDARQTLERHLCKAFKRNGIKLTINSQKLSRLRW